MHMTSQTKVVQSKGWLAEGHITMHNIKQGWVHRHTKIRSLSVSRPEGYLTLNSRAPCRTLIGLEPEIDLNTCISYQVVLLEDILVFW